MLISVIICTYNRSDLLAKVIESLVCQTFDRSKYEIIIVDNNSSDNTHDVVKSFADQENLRYVFEPTQGLSHARNTGLKQAVGEYVSYFDDDCIIPDRWLEKAAISIEKFQPAAFGGPTLPEYFTPKPAWFKDSYHAHNLGNEPKNLSYEHGELLHGNNMSFNRQALEAVGGFNPNLGMSGNKIAYGEDIVIQKLIRKLGAEHQIFYDPELYIYDVVRPEKMQIIWVARQRLVSGRYSQIVLPDSLTESRLSWTVRIPLRVIFRSAALVWSCGASAIWRDRTHYPHIENYLYERTFEHLHALGRVYEEIVATKSPI